RYRRVLGEAAIPIVLIFLWIGWTSVGVDNSAHLGGLAAGLAVAPLLRPRLLADRPRSKWSPALRAIPAIGLLLCLLFGDMIFAAHLPPLRTERDDKFGISVPVPTEWRRGANRLGQLAYNNGLPDLGRATFAAEAVIGSEPADANAEAARFVAEDLQPKGVGEGVLKVNTPSVPKAARIGDRDAVMVKADFDESFGSTHLIAYFVPRGDVVYRLVFTYPEAYPGYAHVVDQMVAGMKFDEPESVRQARASALLFPNAGWSWAQLGESLRRVGEFGSAAEALRVAVKAEPNDVPVRAQYALALLQSGQIENGCKASDDALLYGPRDSRALEVAARCELARGDTAAALLRVHTALEVAPQDERLKAAENKLRASLAQQQP
ncbi:MAG: rhomboid family intramembrane serine protease, partial [Myxococcaceae bacterium]